MAQRRDYYRLLHVDPGAPDEVIKASYRTLMQRMRMHPDLGGDHASAARLNEAFEVLADPERRAAYDRWLGALRQAPVPPTEGAAQCPFCRTPHPPDEPDADLVCATCGAPLCPVQHHEGSEDSRRSLNRMPRFMRVTFAEAAANRAIARGVTQDISLAGMRLLTPALVAPETCLLIECEFCTAVGTVRSVRRHESESHSFEIGIQFATMRLKRPRGSLISTLA